MTKATRKLFLELGEVKIFYPVLTVDCLLFSFWSPADISRTLSLSLSVCVCPLLSCCLYCNFHLLLIPPLSTSHHQQFLFISPLHPFLSLRLSAPRSPCLTAPTRLHSSLFPQHHHVFIITPQPSLGSLHSPLIFLIHPQISVSLPPLFTHFHPLITPQPSCAS